MGPYIIHSRMAFIDKILHVPSYGWTNDNGELVIPTTKQLFNEAISRINIFADKRNWISGISWLMVVCMVPFFFMFLVEYFSIGLLVAFIVYAMIIMSTHGTIWFHRFCTHDAYKFSHPIWRFITQNLVIRTFPEEIYVISHHVHHAKSDQPGDPYNAKAGFLYCMLSDVNHQSVAKDLTEEEYANVSRFMAHTGVQRNNYKQYKKWGSIATPLYCVGMWILNWGFWYGAFYLMGGHGLACAMFGAAMFWFVLVRAFNYNGHGKGEERHKDGVDFDRSNLSINQTRTGLFSGEWHNNHHLYPRSARAGFLPYQLDLPWIYIWSLHKLKMISSYRDSKELFLKKHLPQNLRKGQAARAVT
jgi:fatty-acid desaturase